MKEMRLWLFAGLFISLATSAFGQASFELRNRNNPFVDAPVYDAQGVPLAGLNYRAELWGSETADALVPAVVLNEGLRREIIPFQMDGYFSSAQGMLSVLTTPGGFAWLQVRAWDARLGATWEEVAALGAGGYGESPLFYANGGDPTALELPAPLIGLQSFGLRPIPEPSTWMIGGLGVVSLWLIQRRKQVKR